MTPALPNGGRIRIKLVERVDYRPDEVVAFLRDGAIVVHRVMRNRRRGGWLLTRGDANLVPDAPIAASRVLGPVTGRQRGDTWIPVPDRQRGSARGRLARWLVLLAATAAFELAPKPAAALVTRLQSLDMRRRA